MAIAAGAFHPLSAVGTAELRLGSWLTISNNDREKQRQLNWANQGYPQSQAQR